MKKTLFMAAAVVMTLAACSNDEDAIKINKGMTLIANVENTDTRATIEKVEDSNKWNFIWEDGDAVSVTNPSKEATYTFTKSEKVFSSSDAEPVEGNGWTAVYPADFETNGVSFLNQDGTLASAMKRYYMTGTGSCTGTKLNMTMTPRVAILKVTINNEFFKNKEDRGAAIRQILFKNKNQSSGNCYTNINNAGSIQRSGNISVVYRFPELPTEPIYLIAPAGVDVCLTNNGSQFFTGVKRLEAGHIYNVTFG